MGKRNGIYVTDCNWNQYAPLGWNLGGYNHQNLDKIKSLLVVFIILVRGIIVVAIVVVVIADSYVAFTMH